MSKRFFVRQKFLENGLFTLSDPEHAKEIKHIVKVMRLKAGNAVLLANNHNQEAEAIIEDVQKHSVILRISSVKEKIRSGPSIVLLQSVMKGPKMDWLVEKITEIGVEELCPIITTFTVAASEDGKGRGSRWERIAEAALKQSGGGVLPQIRAVEKLQNAAERHSSAWKFVLHPGPDTPLLWAALKRAEESSAMPEKIVLCVGPEGGISEEEVKLLKQHGFQCVSLGQAILRGESAGLIGTALVRHWIDFKG